jgi:hypothetical protein
MMTKTAAQLRIETLYHYQSFAKPERLAAVLSNGEIYFSNPADFNDPWDCRPWYRPAGSNGALRERYIKWFLRLDRKFNQLTEEQYAERERRLRSDIPFLDRLVLDFSSSIGATIAKQYRVYCLSPHPDHTLMWSHYARSHTGVCLEFSVRNELFCAALPIEYRDIYPEFDLATDDEDENLLPLLTKSIDWKYEDEFRVLAAETPYEFPHVPMTKGGFLPLPKEALLSVIVGASMSEADREKLKVLVKAAGGRVGLKEAALIPDRYAVQIRPLI